MTLPPRPTPSTVSRRLPVTRWLGRAIRPSFLMSMCSKSHGASCSQRCTGSLGCRSPNRDSPARASTRLTVEPIRLPVRRSVAAASAAGAIPRSARQSLEQWSAETRGDLPLVDVIGSPLSALTDWATHRQLEREQPGKASWNSRCNRPRLIESQISPPSTATDTVQAQTPSTAMNLSSP